MLVIVNPYATTVSDRLQAPRRLRAPGPLRGRRRRHRGARATPPSSAARPRTRATTSSSPSAATARSTRRPTACVGSGTPLTCLPGGSTNVYCRMLGIPNDIVDATEHLLRMADDWQPARRSTSARQRPPLHLLRRRRPRRRASSSASTRHPRAEGALRRRGTSPAAAIADVHAPLPRPPAAARGRADGGEPLDGRDRDRPERHAVHVLREPPDRASPRAPTLDDGTLGRRRARRAPARSTCRRHLPRARPARARIVDHRRVDGFAGARPSVESARATAARSRSRSTATTSATSTRRASRRSGRADRRLLARAAHRRPRVLAAACARRRAAARRPRARAGRRVGAPPPACPIFPKDHPVEPARRQAAGRPPFGHATSARSALGADFHADFGSGRYDGGPIGIPYHGRRRGQPKVKVGFDYAAESDKGPYPIPPSVPIEGGPSTATATRSSSTGRAAATTSCTARTAPARAGTPARARSGTCARTAAGRGLDVGRRRRPADPPRAGALRRRRARLDRPRAALHRAADAPAPSSTPPATRPATGERSLPPMGLRAPASRRRRRCAACRARRA